MQSREFIEGRSESKGHIGIMFDIKKTFLLVIDVQGNLANRMHGKEVLFKNIKALIKAAEIFQLPVVYTEQLPEKIGKTIPEIALMLKDLKPIEKQSFSCCVSQAFRREIIQLNRKQVIVCGIETHVCVYQTVADLLALKYKVEVVADAVASRTLENKNIALERIKSLGAGLTSTEMIACELLKTAAHEKLKRIYS